MQPAAATYNLNDWGNPSTEVRVGSTPSKKSIEGRDRYKQMTLATFEFIHRFLIHVLPKGLHRVRHYGLFAKGSCADNIARARELLAAAKSDGGTTAAAVDPGKST
jgi:Putative transposase